MRADPFSDVLHFLTAPNWRTLVFWLLLLGSAWVARTVWARDPDQRTARHLTTWLLRVLAGSMWWQGSLWKVPPDYGGLLFWLKQEVDHAAFALQSEAVAKLVVPNIAVFGPLVYAVEVAIAASYILGLYTRAGAVLGILMAGQLWLGQYSTPNEWPWTYMFLIILQVQFFLVPPGRSLGADALVRRRAGSGALAAWLA